MRRDVFIQNDSGGFSVLAGDAVDAIIEDGRTDDERFVASYKTLLLELYGDDSMPVRIVVDEPLRADEQAQWLAKTSWRIDTSDGRLLVMGGFDPDVLQWWKDDTSAGGDGRGVALVEAAPGSLRVDVYAHVGSMNGRQILSEADEKPGAAFRRSHSGRPFPIWLAKMLQFSGEEDPGHEHLWTDVRRSMAERSVAIDTSSASAIGFLIHVTRDASSPGDPPSGGWFERDTNRRVPDTFPLGLPSDVADPELEMFRDGLLGRPAPAAGDRPVPTAIAEIIEVWSGDPLKAVRGEPAVLPLGHAYFVYWMMALTADSPPGFELWIEPVATWQPPAPCPEFAVVSKSGSVTAIGPAPGDVGWALWWSARRAAETLGNVPEGSTIDLAMRPRTDPGEESESAVGRAMYSGRVKGGAWHITAASPAVTSEILQEALVFVRDLVEYERLRIRGDGEREALDRAAGMFSPEEDSLVWDGDTVMLAEPEERTLLLLASAVFRVRFGEQWPVDVEEEW